MIENNGNIREKNLKPFKPGESGNPAGRPKGQRDYATLYREALIKLGKSLNKEPDELEIELLQTGLLNAKKGDYRFYKDVLDRTHGTAVNHSQMDVTSKGEQLAPAVNIEEIAKGVAEKLKQIKVYGDTDKGTTSGS